MRRLLFVGNWKANKNIAETEEYFQEMRHFSEKFDSKTEVVICPSFVNLECAKRNLVTNVKLGAQDVSHISSGAYCGEVTAAMLKSVGVEYCIVGHVERRSLGEDNVKINAKVKRALENGLTPILCVGDTLAEYNSDKTREVIEKQVREGLDGVHELERIVVAYQPIWSIGTGAYSTGYLANMIADFIRKVVTKMTGNAMSANFPILYGGGVTTSNAREYLESPEIDGLMVGGTSLKAATMAEIVNTRFAVKKYDK